MKSSITSERQMTARHLCISRRSIAIAVALVGMASLAIGAHASLNKPTPDRARAIAPEQSGQPSRIGLVIGSNYPDAQWLTNITTRY